MTLESFGKFFLILKNNRKQENNSFQYIPFKEKLQLWIYLGNHFKCLRITFQKEDTTRSRYNPTLLAAFISADLDGSHYSILCSIFLTLVILWFWWQTGSLCTLFSSNENKWQALDLYFLLTLYVTYLLIRFTTSLSKAQQENVFL